MNRRLIIGNLSLETTEPSLNKFFSSAGCVRSVVLITDAQSGRKKGFAFVDMSTHEEAQSAVHLLNGAEIDGRQIIVNQSEPSPQSSKTFIGKFMQLLQGKRCLS